MKSLKEMRLELGLTQANVAHKLNVTLSIYNFWEKGRKTPKPSNRIKVEKFFGVNDYFQHVTLKKEIDNKIFSEKELLIIKSFSKIDDSLKMLFADKAERIIKTSSEINQAMKETTNLEIFKYPLQNAIIIYISDKMLNKVRTIQEYSDLWLWDENEAAEVIRLLNE